MLAGCPRMTSSSGCPEPAASNRSAAASARSGARHPLGDRRLRHHARRAGSPRRPAPTPSLGRSRSAREHGRGSTIAAISLTRDLPTPPVAQYPRRLSRRRHQHRRGPALDGGRLRKPSGPAPKRQPAPPGRSHPTAAATAKTVGPHRPSTGTANSHCDMAGARRAGRDPNNPKATSVRPSYRSVHVWISGQRDRTPPSWPPGATAPPQTPNLEVTLCGCRGRRRHRRTAENAGFLRVMASLFVIFVTDEETARFGGSLTLSPLLDTQRPKQRPSHLSPAPSPGPDPDGPAGPTDRRLLHQRQRGAGTPKRGTRYASLAMLAKPRPRSREAAVRPPLSCGPPN